LVSLEKHKPFYERDEVCQGRPFGVEGEAEAWAAYVREILPPT
jgi:hypothetical protein